MDNDFKIPAPYTSWCHLCDEGFMSIAQVQEHDRANLNKHQRIQQAIRDSARAEKNEEQEKV